MSIQEVAGRTEADCFRIAVAKREQSACKILDVWVVSTTSVGRQLAASLLVFAFRHGDISERVFDQYLVRLNGLEVAA